MSRVRTRLGCLVVFGVLSVAGAGGCGSRREALEHDAPRPAIDPVASVDLRRYFPATPGDRWRVVHEPGRTFDHYGVSALDRRGHAIVHGTDHTTIDLVVVDHDGASFVDPEGTPVVPIIRAPIERGASHAYTVGEGASEGHCVLTVTDASETVSVAGRAFEACFSQRRVCAMPSGGGLPVATTFTEDETYCPTVGRVKHRFRAEPPLPFDGVSSDRRTDLVSFHVRGAPVMAAGTPIADRLIVLPTDLSAACGGSVAWSDLRVSATAATAAPAVPVAPAAPAGAPLFPVPADARASDALLAFGMTDGPFVLEARAAEGALTAYVGGADTGRQGFGDGATFVRLTPNPSCRTGASALEPLLRSLLR